MNKKETIEELLNCVRKVEAEWMEEYGCVFNTNWFENHDESLKGILFEFGKILYALNDINSESVDKICSLVSEYIEKEMINMAYELGKIYNSIISYPLMISKTDFSNFTQIMLEVGKYLDQPDNVNLLKQIQTDLRDKEGFKIKIYILYIMKNPKEIGLNVGASRVLDAFQRVIQYE